MKTKQIIAAMCGGLIAFSAAAQTTTTATVSNVSYRLVDLDPNDGIAPSLTVVNYGTVTGPSSLTAGFEMNAVQVDVIGPSANMPINLAETHGTASASGAITGDGALASMGLSVTAKATGDGSFTFIQASAQAGSGLTNFLLSPKTQVIFTADSSQIGQTQQAGDWAVANSWISILTYVNGQPDYVQSPWNTMNSYNVGGGAHTETWNGVLTVSYQNLSDAAQVSAFGAGAAVNSDGFGAPLPVPEPSTYAMLLAGLAMTGFAARRRSR